MSMIPTLRRLTLRFRSLRSVAVSRQPLRFVAALSLLTVFGLLTQPSTQAQAVSGPVVATMSIFSLAGGGSTVPTTTAEPNSSANIEPTGVTIDSAGDIYIADYGNSLIEEIVAATGQIAVIAGGGSNAPSPTPALPTSVQLRSPTRVALDSAGNLYIADYGNNLIEEIVAATGQIAVIAGGGSNAPSPTPALPTSVSLSNPSGVAVDSNGNVYIAGYSSGLVEEVTGLSGPNPQIVVIAGAGSTMPSSTPEALASASLNSPSNVVVDQNGNLYIADYGFGMVDEVTGLSGPNPQIAAVAGGGSTIPSSTPMSGFSANIDPWDVTVDSSGNLYLADLSHEQLEEVTGVADMDPQIISIAGGGGTSPTATPEAAPNAIFSSIYGIAVDSSGNVYGADYGGSIDQLIPSASFSATAVGAASATKNVFVELTTSNLINGISVPAVQNGAQEFTVGTITGCDPSGGHTNNAGTVCTVPVTFHPQYPGLRTGSLTLYDVSGTTILGTVGLSGIGTGPLGVFSPGTTTTTSISGMVRPGAVAADAAGDVFLADSDKNAIFEVNAQGVTSTVNTGSPGGTAIYIPTDVAVDGAGNLYIADQGNGRVVELSAAGVASVVNTGSLTAAAGLGGTCGNKPLCDPNGVAVDGWGNLYIADTYYNRIVEITTGGAVSVIASGSPGGESLSLPDGLAVDAAGDLYIADTGNNRIVEVTAAGTSSVIDTGSYSLSSATKLAVDAAGDLYIADEGNSRIVEVSAAGVASVVNTGSVTLNRANGVAVDGAGNIDIADTLNKELLQISPTASALTFASTAVGAISSDSPQAVTVQNIGNAALTFTALAATTNFDLNGADATCTSTTSLAAGYTCALGIDFAPTAVGSLTGTVNITDNSLNVAANVEQVSLSGTGIIAATTTTLTASATSITAGQSETFTATVMAGTTPVIGDSINFLSGGTVLGTGTLNGSGMATFTTSTLAVGTDSITASYAGSANDAGSTSATVTVTVAAPIAPSYTMTANPTSLTIAAGQTGTTTLTFTPVGGYTGSVTLSCGSLPSFATCAFNGGTSNANGSSNVLPPPFTVTMDGSNTPINVMLTIATNVAPSAINAQLEILQTPGARPAALLAAAKTPTPMNPVLPALAFWGPGGLAGLAVFGRKRKRTKKQFGFLHLGLLVLLTGALAAGVSGCGGSSSTAASKSITPAGTSTVVITATPTTGSSQTLNLSVTITG